jgi:hypothetical protein
MDLNSLLRKLDIESPEQLEYFEQFAELAEIEGDIPEDVLMEFFRDADADALRELSDAYFEEIITGVPDDAADFYLLLTQIGRAFAGLADAIGGYDERRAYAEEFSRFRHWYTNTDSVVYITPDGSGEQRFTVLEALAQSRADTLTGANNDEASPFDFAGALNYEIDEYAVSLRTLANAEDDDGDGDE